MPVSRKRQRRALSWTAAAAALVAILLLPAAASAEVKPYTVSLAPSSVPAGAEAVVTATFTNGSAQQSLGSADLAAPTALTVRSASLPAGSAGSATVRGGVIELRDLSLAPGASLAVAVTVDVGCAEGVYAWSVNAKQSNRFNGAPGNNFTLVSPPADLNTTVSGGCALHFVTQPQDARVGERLTGADFDPAGPPVSVEVVDGAGERVTSSTVAISLALASATGPGALAGTTTVTAIAGLAEFGNLSVSAPGTYTLGASASGVEPAVSAAFTIQQLAVRCVEDVDCSAQLSTPRSSVEARAFANTGLDAGFLQLSFNAGFRPDCAGYQEFSADWAVVLGPDRQKLVVFTIDKRVMNASPNNGVSFLQMCFAAPYTFATPDGGPPAEVDTDGDGVTDWFVATLPDCGGPPCVQARRKDKAGDGIIEVLAPGGAEDPAYRP